MLEKLRNAVKKVKFLLNFNLNRWRLASITSNKHRPTLSFNDRPGLRAFTDDHDDYMSRDYLSSGRELSGSFSSRSSSPPSSSYSSSPSIRRIERTISCPSDDDIDKRAEMFIANFKRRLLIERQVSLQLRYSRGNSFDQYYPYTSPDR